MSAISLRGRYFTWVWTAKLKWLRIGRIQIEWVYAAPRTKSKR